MSWSVFLETALVVGYFVKWKTQAKVVKLYNSWGLGQRFGEWNFVGATRQSWWAVSSRVCLPRFWHAGGYRNLWSGLLFWKIVLGWEGPSQTCLKCWCGWRVANLELKYIIIIWCNDVYKHFHAEQISNIQVWISQNCKICEAKRRPGSVSSRECARNLRRGSSKSLSRDFCEEKLWHVLFWLWGFELVGQWQACESSKCPMGSMIWWFSIDVHGVSLHLSISWGSSLCSTSLPGTSSSGGFRWRSTTSPLPCLGMRWPPRWLM